MERWKKRKRESWDFPWGLEDFFSRGNTLEGKGRGLLGIYLKFFTIILKFLSNADFYHPSFWEYV